MINSVFMQIVVISYIFLSKVIKLVKIFSFKFLKVNLNIVLETVVFNVCSYVLVEFVYYILVENIIVSRFNIYIPVKKNF